MSDGREVTGEREQCKQQKIFIFLMIHKIMIAQTLFQLYKKSIVATAGLLRLKDMKSGWVVLASHTILSIKSTQIHE